jgi:hypothetical protein
MSTSIPDSPKADKQPLSVWELHRLIEPVHLHRRSKGKTGKERRHFPAIVSFLAKNRFATATQIQRRFPDYLKSGRTCRRHLAELQDLGYIDTVAETVSPLWPKVYFATQRGIGRLQRIAEKKGRSFPSLTVERRRTEGHTASHLHHELCITEFLLEIRDITAQQDDLDLLSVHRRGLAGHASFRFPTRIGTRELRPDALVLLRHQRQGMMCYFGEIDCGTMGTKQLQAKFRRYEQWSQSRQGKQFLIDLYRKHGANNPQPAFRMLFTCVGRYGTTDNQRAEQIRKVARSLPQQLQSRVIVTTPEDLAETFRQSRTG